MAARRTVLLEELQDEVIYRLPPDQPSSLLRASAVSRAWRAFVTDPAFIRRYRKFHKTPPVLGFVQNNEHNDDPNPLFYPAATPSPPIDMPEFEDGCYPATLDCRHGRLLYHFIYPLCLVVWNLITGDYESLPEYPMRPYNSCTAALLCYADGCDHLDCSGGDFLVVFASSANIDPVGADGPCSWASLYSSETGTWSEPTTVHHGPLPSCPEGVMGPSLLVGDVLYFTLDLEHTRTVLRYDIAEAELSLMNPPPLVTRDTFLVTGDDGGLGLAAVEAYCLRLWSWRAGVWTPGRIIDLKMMIPFTIGVPTTVIKVIGFAEMSGVIVLSVNEIISTVELKSGKIREVGRMANFTTVFPFESFYTPEIGGA